MAQNITLMGANYSDVPAVNLPKTGGGTATFTDVSDTTATATDVGTTKYFYTANGVKTQGSATMATATVSNGKLTLTDGFPNITPIPSVIIVVSGASHTIFAPDGATVISATNRSTVTIPTESMFVVQTSGNTVIQSASGVTYETIQTSSGVVMTAYAVYVGDDDGSVTLV